MIVYLIRHAIAVAREAGAFSNGGRPLTSVGSRKMHKAARGMRKLGVHVTEIWSSPLVRAHQTAQIVREELGEDIAIQTVDALSPDGDFDAIFQKLAECKDKGPVALVGHEPDLGELGSYLLTGRRESFLRFKKGGAACFQIDDFGSTISASLI